MMAIIIMTSDMEEVGKGNPSQPIPTRWKGVDLANMVTNIL